MTISSSLRPTGWRILGFGKHPEFAAAVEEQPRSLGFRATTFVLTNDEAGNARLVTELKRAEYDGVVIGAPGVGVAPGAGAGEPGVGAGAPGPGVAPANPGGPVNRVGVPKESNG